MNGLYLQKNQLSSILKQKKTYLVKTTNIDTSIAGDIFLLSKNRIYAIAKLQKIKTVNAHEFDTYYQKHRITPEQRKKWWGDINSYHLYEIDVKKTFNPNLYWKMGKNPSTIVENVEVEMAVTVKIPIGQIVPETTALLNEFEKKQLQRQIDLVKTYCSEPDKLLLKKVEKENEPEIKNNPYVLQIRFVNVEKGDVMLGIEELKSKYYDYVYDLRLQINENDMLGWTLHAEEVDIKTIRAVKKCSHDAKLWLKIALKKSYILGNDDDTGEYVETKINDNAYQYVYWGTLLDGNYVCSKRLKSKNWVMEKLI